MLDTLFIYGVYSIGTAQFERIAPYVRESYRASLVGCAYRLPIGFPVYLAQGYGRIAGHVVKVNHPEVLFALLDQSHGVSNSTASTGMVMRIEVSAQLETDSDQGPETIQSYVYALSPDRLPRLAKLIEDGDWERSLNESPPLPTRLTERQKTYIRKLATSHHRDVVPIDMTLYQELVRMDLVIDKGRRLALTSLGHDVARYLT